MESVKSTFKQKKVSVPSLGMAVMRSLLATVILLPCLLLVAATVAYNSDNPTALIRPLSYACALFSALFCGFFTARMRGRQGLICGLCSGLGLLCLFLVGLAVFAGEGEMQVTSLLLFYPVLFVLTVLGGILGGARRVDGKRHRRPTRRG